MEKLRIVTVTLPEMKRRTDSEWGNRKGHWKSLLTGVDMVLHSAEIVYLYRYILC